MTLEIVPKQSEQGVIMNKIDLIIDVLEGYFDDRPLGLDKMHKALAAARELKALAQPEQEPVCWWSGSTYDSNEAFIYNKDKRLFEDEDYPIPLFIKE